MPTLGVFARRDKKGGGVTGRHWKQEATEGMPLRPHRVRRREHAVSVQVGFRGCEPIKMGEGT